jgi:hypothetical protein
LSTESLLIKVVNTAPSENIRANEIEIETTKTCKVTVLVAVMSIYCKKDAVCGALILGTRSFLTKRQIIPISQKKVPAEQKKPFSENKKRPVTKEISSVIKEIRAK